jgi:ABC-type transport system substrate-binding protein
MVRSKRADYLEQLYKIYFDEIPWFFTYQNVTTYAMTNKVQGFSVGPILDVLWSKIWLPA